MDQRPNPSAAPVCKVRLRYAKRGNLRFTSHRDVARAFERALRRAGLPMAYSQGYNPHPKVSWVGAAPTGTASEAEYVEIALVAPVEPDVVRAELDAALPEGLAVLEGVLAGAGGLAERIEASRWRIEIPGLDTEQLRRAASALLAAPEVLVERVTKDGKRRIDARAAIVGLAVEDPPVHPPEHDHLPECGILVAVVRQASPAVRPDDVLSALGVVAGLRPLAPARATRVAQGRLDDDGGLVDPLAPDRAAARIVPVESSDDEPDQHGVAAPASRASLTG
ncbi:MAG: TIGR03936 family radical SAM-associated protein [Pseudonocardiaceae bacterium]